MLIALAAAVVLAQAAPTPSTATAPAAPAKALDAAAVSVKPPKPKRVCHDEKPMGSIIATRVCRTVAQTEAEAQESRREQDALSDHLAACHGAAC